jgi:hypothetical protein
MSTPSDDVNEPVDEGTSAGSPAPAERPSGWQRFFAAASDVQRSMRERGAVPLDAAAEIRAARDSRP